MGAITPLSVIGLPGVNWASVSDYGAKGDGVTDDLTALKAAVASGRDLYFNAGSTYKISGPLFLNSGQNLYFNRAILSNVNQITDTTTTNITTSGNQNITVTNGAKWTVGQSVTVYDGVNFDPSPHPIASIVGNVLHLGTVFSQAFPSGGTVYLCGYTIVTADNNRVCDLVMDGNKSNWTFYRWQTTGGISMAGTNSFIDNPYLHDMPSEGIVMFGTDNRVMNMRGLNFNGNGIHFSGATTPLVDGIKLTNINLDTSVGHANGGVIWSNSIVDALVNNVSVTNAITAIGSIDSFGNSDCTVSNVIARNCTQAGIGMNASASYSAPCRVNLTNIRTYGCPYGVQITSNISFALTVTGATNANPIAVTTSVNHQMSDGQPVILWGVTGNTATNGTYYVKATGNAANVVTLYQDEGLNVGVSGNGSYVSGGSILAQVANVTLNGVHCYDSTTNSLYLQNVRDISGSGNQFVMKGGSGAPVNVQISSCQNVALHATTIRGGSYGFYCQDPQGTSQNIVLNGNTISSQYNAGISMITAGQQNMASTSNAISPDTTAVSTYDGIILGSASAAIANGVYVPSNVTAIHSGVNFSNSGIALANTVQTPSSSYRTMLMSGGSSNNTALLNMTSTAPTDNQASTNANANGLNFDPYGNTINALVPKSNASSTTSAALQSFGPTGSAVIVLSPPGQGTVAFNKHLSGSQALTSITGGTNAGSGATASTNADGDTMGAISFTTGTGSAAGQLIVVTCQYQGSNLRMLLTPTNAAASGLQTYTQYDGSGNLLSVHSVNAPADSTTYTWAYMIFNAT